MKQTLLLLALLGSLKLPNIIDIYKVNPAIGMREFARYAGEYRTVRQPVWEIWPDNHIMQSGATKIVTNIKIYTLSGGAWIQTGSSTTSEVSWQVIDESSLSPSWRFEPEIADPNMTIEEAMELFQVMTDPNYKGE